MMTEIHVGSCGVLHFVRVLVNYSYISKVSADLVDAAVTTSADDGSFSEA
eukprot:COSAG05_NODE_26046_length_191_cov_41.380435_1_plen_49_part_10